MSVKAANLQIDRVVLDGHGQVGLKRLPCYAYVAGVHSVATCWTCIINKAKHYFISYRV